MKQYNAITYCHLARIKNAMIRQVNAIMAS